MRAADGAPRPPSPRSGPRRTAPRCRARRTSRCTQVEQCVAGGDVGAVAVPDVHLEHPVLDRVPDVGMGEVGDARAATRRARPASVRASLAAQWSSHGLEHDDVASPQRRRTRLQPVVAPSGAATPRSPSASSRSPASTYSSVRRVAVVGVARPRRRTASRTSARTSSSVAVARPHLDASERPELFEPTGLVEAADRHQVGVPRRAGHQPRSASRCGCGISSTLMPTMASPRPRETLAITSGSS